MISWISEVIHYLLPEGCVHVYGDATNAESGVPWEAVARCEAVPWKEPAGTCWGCGQTRNGHGNHGKMMEKW